MTQKIVCSLLFTLLLAPSLTAQEQQPPDTARSFVASGQSLSEHSKEAKTELRPTPDSGKSVSARALRLRPLSLFARWWGSSTKSAARVGLAQALNKMSIGGNLAVGKDYSNIAAPADGVIIQGNVGIGTTAPSAKLEVNGSIVVQGCTGCGSGTSQWVTTGPNIYFNTGNVGIGTTNPVDKLTVQTGTGFYGFTHTDGNGVSAITLSSYVGGSASGALGGWFGTRTNHALHLFTNNGQPALTVSTDSKVGIGTTNPAAKLEVQGDIKLDNGFLRSESIGDAAAPPNPACWYIDPVKFDYYLARCPFSSLRYKTEVKSFAAGLAIINRLRPITFNWKQDGKPDLGLGAEEIAQVEPLLVTHNQQGEIEEVKYDRLTVVLINAVKEQQAQIQEQQKLIGQLQSRLTRLERINKQPQAGLGDLSSGPKIVVTKGRKVQR